MGDISHIKNITVIGAGIQGHAITQIALMAGFENVTLNDLTMEIIEKGVSLIHPQKTTPIACLFLLFLPHN